MKFRLGDSYVTDDVTGLKIRRSEAMKRWDGAVTAKENFEPRHPQEFVRVRPEKGAVQPARPEPPHEFMGPLVTRTLAPAGITAFELSVVSSVRMEPGDRISVMLSNGDTFFTSITEIPSTEAIRINPVLPRPVDADAVIVNFTAMREPQL